MPLASRQNDPNVRHPLTPDPLLSVGATKNGSTRMSSGPSRSSGSAASLLARAKTKARRLAKFLTMSAGIRGGACVPWRTSMAVGSPGTTASRAVRSGVSVLRRGTWDFESGS